MFGALNAGELSKQKEDNAWNELARFQNFEPQNAMGLTPSWCGMLLSNLKDLGLGLWP